MSDRRNCLKGIEEVLKAVINAGTWYSSALEIDQYEQPYNGEQLEEMLKQVLSDLRSGKMVVLTAEENDVIAVEYVLKEEHGGIDPITIHRMVSPFYPEERWAVRLSCYCLSTGGQWEYEPMPSSRDMDFYDKFRFMTFTDAILAAKIAYLQRREEE